MKIKGKNITTLIKAYNRLKHSNPIKAGHIKAYLHGKSRYRFEEKE